VEGHALALLELLKACALHIAHVKEQVLIIACFDKSESLGRQLLDFAFSHTSNFLNEGRPASPFGAPGPLPHGAATNSPGCGRPLFFDSGRIVLWLRRGRRRRITTLLLGASSVQFLGRALTLLHFAPPFLKRVLRLRHSALLRVIGHGGSRSDSSPPCSLTASSRQQWPT
jgi:hypothetical protein